MAASGKALSDRIPVDCTRSRQQMIAMQSVVFRKVGGHQPMPPFAQRFPQGTTGNPAMRGVSIPRDYRPPMATDIGPRVAMELYHHQVMASTPPAPGAERVVPGSWSPR